MRAGFSTVPPDFTDVRIVVSSALSSVIFFRRSSGRSCLSSRFLRIASFYFLLVLNNYWNLSACCRFDPCCSDRNGFFRLLRLSLLCRCFWLWLDYGFVDVINLRW